MTDNSQVLLPGGKLCSRCHALKPLEAFHKSSQCTSGYASECRECRKGHYHRKCEERRKNPPKPDARSRICHRCDTTLPLACFNRNIGGKDGLSSHCKTCNAINCKRRYAERAAVPAEREKIRERSRDYHRKERHGFKQGEYRAMHDAQNGLCAICGKPETTRRRSHIDIPRDLCIDHNHRTGARRSLLCSLCNSGLGSFRENIDALKSAIAYLERHQQGDDQSLA